MAKVKKPLYENSLNEPNVVYVTTTDLKNRLGEVLDLALIENKEVVLRKHGREVLRLSKIERKKKDGKALHDEFFGSIPDLELDEEFRKGFKPREFDID
jgi:antitoxin (DNA-binding transcriptional repressor) of toxin-antitoxin stability system